MTAVDDNVDQEEVVENVTYCSDCDDYCEHEILKERSIGSGRGPIAKVSYLCNNFELAN